MHISIWEQDTYFARRDVIIIGSGLAGLWYAYELLTKHPSLNVLVVDKGLVPAGASTRNAGFACFGSPTELLHDAATKGEEHMLQTAEMRFKGIKKTRKVLGDQAIEYDNCGGYECLRNDINDIETILQKLSWLNKSLQPITGDENTFIISNEKLNGLGFQGFDALLANRHEGGLHSGKLVMALQEKVRSLGGQIMNGMDVEKWEENDNEITLFAKQNIQLKTSRLFICTNGLGNHLLASDFITPARGQIIVTAPISNLAVRGTFHFDEGFYYFRNIGNRLLLGGARNQFLKEEETSSFETSEQVQDRLEQFLQAHILPDQSYKIEYRWSGVMGFTEDKKPMVKRLSKKVTAIVICNGMGVALAPIIAEQIEL